MTNGITFRWLSSYMNVVDYDVFGDGQTYRISVRHRVDDYEKSISNYTADEWERDVVAAVGLVHRASNWLPLAPATVDAFNAWRAANHAAFIQQLRNAPERYGALADNDPLLAAPPVARGARYEVGRGWVVNP